MKRWMTCRQKSYKKAKDKQIESDREMTELLDSQNPPGRRVLRPEKR